MKAKVLIPLILMLIITVFASNWIYGNISAKKLDAYLKHLPNNAKIDYDKLKMNPLWSKITFIDFTYFYPNSSYSIKSKKLDITMKYSEAMEIARTGNVKSITKLLLNFQDAQIFENSELAFSGDDLLVDFRGDLNKGQLLNISNQFPDKKQKIRLEIKDAQFNQDIYNKSNIKEGASKFNKIKSAITEISIDPNESKFELTDVNIDMDVLEFIGEAKMEYIGTGVEGVKIVLADVEYNCELSDELIWGEKDAKYTLQTFNSSFDGVIEFDEDGEILGLPKDAEFSVYIKDLGIGCLGKNKQEIESQLSMLGLNTTDLFVSEFSFNTTIESGICTIDNSKLVLPVLQADLQAKFNVEGDDLEDSNIKEMQMRISNINSRLGNALVGLESTFGFKIPRDGDDILLEVKGSLNKPQVKGIHY